MPIMLRLATKLKGMFHVKRVGKREIVISEKPSAICYRAIAEAIYKTLKEKENADHKIDEVAS